MKLLALASFSAMLSAQTTQPPPPIPAQLANPTKTFYYTTDGSGVNSGDCDLMHQCTWNRAISLLSKAGGKANLVGNNAYISEEEWRSLYARVDNIGGNIDKLQELHRDDHRLKALMRDEIHALELTIAVQKDEIASLRRQLADAGVGQIGINSDSCGKENSNERRTR